MPRCRENQDSEICSSRKGEQKDSDVRGSQNPQILLENGEAVPLGTFLEQWRLRSLRQIEVLASISRHLLQG
jgi:hypothetical protein